MTGISMPKFTAEACLPAKGLSGTPYVGMIHGPSSCVVEPTAAGPIEQKYIDCVTDCRTAARLHQISDVSKCIRDCAAPGTSGGTTSGSTSGGSSSAPAAPCLPGNVLVTCPDGFVGCCPSPFSSCTIFQPFGRICI